MDTVGGGFPSSGVQFGSTFYDIDDKTTWVFLGGDPRLVSNWKLLNGVFADDPDTTQWGQAQAGAMWYNRALQALRIWDGSISSSIKIAGVPISLYDYKTALRFQDDFIAGTTASGSVGSLGWSFDVGTGGSVVLHDSEPNNQGIIGLRSGTTISNTTVLRLIGATNVHTANSFDFLFLVRPVDIDTDTTIRIGISTNPPTVPPTSGIYFEKLSADVNWFCVARTGGVETRVNSGVSLTVAFTLLRIERSQGNVKYYINGTLVATITTNIPSVAATPTVNITTDVAVTKSIQIDYIQLQITVAR